MSRPKCVLHVGTMKTATSSIQSWLKTNSEWLRTEGWIYPGWPFRHSDRFQDFLALAENRNLIISDEGLWHFGGTRRSDTKEISKLLEFYDIRVVVYFRRPDVFLESWFKQGLKFGTGTHSIAKFLESEEVLKSVLPRLDYFTKIFGKNAIVVAPYEVTQFSEGNIISDFIEKAGLPKPTHISSARENDIRANESPNADTMLMAGLLRKVFHMEQSDIEAFLKSSLNEKTLNRSMSILTPEERSRIIAHFRPQFVKIQSRFGTGTGSDFFLEWGDQSPAPEVSPLRCAYDKYMEQVLGN